MRIAVMQANATVGDQAANLRAIDEAAARAAGEGADVLVTPELFVSGYAPLLLRTVDPDAERGILAELGRIAKHRKVALVASYPQVEEPAEEKRRQYICAVLFDASGELAVTYRKVHLFGDDEPRAFACSEAPPTTVELAGLRVSLLICFDVEFPEAVRAAAVAGADVVLAPTALAAGFDDVPQVLLRARALENGVALAYANHTGEEDGLVLGGGSVIVGPDGGLLAEGDDAPRIILGDVTRDDIDAARREVDYLGRRRPTTYAAWERDG